MRYLKGVVTAVRQCGGCIEVTVSGPRSGSFPIDNCCVPALLDPDGLGLIGRLVEYRNGHMRFPDEPEIAESKPVAYPIMPFPHPACSSDHI